MNAKGSGKRQYKNWTRPFVLVSTKAEFDQLLMAPAEETDPAQHPDKQQEDIIILPKFQVLPHSSARHVTRLHMPQYIKIMKNTNVPFLNKYELTEVELEFMKVNLLAYGIGEQAFCEMLVKLQKVSMEKGLDFAHEEALGRILRKNMTRGRKGIEKKAVAWKIFYFWRKKRADHLFGQFPFYRPFWPKIQISGGPFRSRSQGEMSLRNRTNKVQMEEIHDILLEDLQRLKQIFTLMLLRADIEVKLMESIVNTLSYEQMKRPPVTQSRSPSPKAARKHKFQVEEKGKIEDEARQQTVSKGLREKPIDSSLVGTKLEIMNNLFDKQGRYSKESLMAFAESEVKQKYMTRSVRKYYFRVQPREEDLKAESSFQWDLKESNAELIKRFAEGKRGQE